MTISVPIVTGQARQDLHAQVRWLRQHADRDVAKSFAINATLTFHKLAAQPGLGAEIDSSNLRLIGVRKWRVEGFPKILIFYKHSNGRIAIVRVLHAAQDWFSLLDLG